MSKIFSPLRCLIFTTLLLTSSAFGLGQSYTVCQGGGCDFATLTDALTSPGLGDDTITLTSDYVFDPLIENPNPYVPVGVTIICDAGADTIGDSAEATVSWNIDSNTTIENCTFDNNRMESSNKTDVTIRNNTFIGTVNSQIFINATDGFEVNGNIGIQEIYLGSSDNGTVSGNQFECNNSCFRITGYGTITDFTDPAQIANNVDISNNTMIFYEPNTYGDWIYIGNGDNINLTNNMIHSAVTVDNQFITMISIQSAEVNLSGNTIIMPEKSAPNDQSTWAVNLRADQEHLELTMEHNTIIYDSIGNSGSNCLGLYADASHPQGTTDITYRYNMCYNASGVGNGVALNYDMAGNVITLSESYNGFFGLTSTISDNNGNFSTIDTTSTTADPVLRREDMSSSDDNQVAPMSSYLDVNGTEDIGAYSASRVTNYTIDQNCTVDYSSCHSKLSTILASVMRSGDTITIGSGTYTPINIPSGLTDITLQGAGSTTILDATGVAQGLTLNSLSNSTISDLAITNATTETHVYNMFAWSMSAGGTDYNLVGPTALYVSGPTCNQNTFLAGPYTDVTGVEGIGTSNIGLYLVHVPSPFPDPDLYLTILLPNSVAANPAAIEAQCGFPAAFFEHYVLDAFTLQPDGSYTYDAAAVASAGITTLGVGDPFITKVVTRDAGISLTDSDNNAFENLLFAGNSDDVYLDSGSSGNTFTENAFDGSDHDIVSDATSLNSLSDSTFDFASLDVNGAGPLEIYYTLDALVRNAADTLPIEGATITVKNVSNVVTNTLTTDVSGIATESILATIVTNSGTPSATSGGLNPFSFTTSASGFLTQYPATTLTAPYHLAIDMVAGTDPVVVPSLGGGGSVTLPTIPTTPVPTQSPDTTSETSHPENTSHPTTPSSPTPEIIPPLFSGTEFSSMPNMYLGVRGENVRKFQQFLNQIGFTIAASGPGSAGNETTYFGRLTRAALARFQKAYNIFPAYGYFGPKTRKFLETFTR